MLTLPTATGRRVDHSQLTCSEATPDTAATTARPSLPSRAQAPPAPTRVLMADDKENQRPLQQRLSLSLSIQRQSLQPRSNSDALLITKPQPKTKQTDFERRSAAPQIPQRRFPPTALLSLHLHLHQPSPHSLNCRHQPHGLHPAVGLPSLTHWPLCSVRCSAAQTGRRRGLQRR